MKGSRCGSDKGRRSVPLWKRPKGQYNPSVTVIPDAGGAAGSDRFVCTLRQAGKRGKIAYGIEAKNKISA